MKDEEIAEFVALLQKSGGTGRVVAVIEALQARVKALETPWISVTDRLPKPGENVIAWWQGSAGITRRPYFKAKMVTHWQPLPPPPQP